MPNEGLSLYQNTKVGLHFIEWPRVWCWANRSDVAEKDFVLRAKISIADSNTSAVCALIILNQLLETSNRISISSSYSPTTLLLLLFKRWIPLAKLLSLCWLSVPRVSIGGYMICKKYHMICSLCLPILYSYELIIVCSCLYHMHVLCYHYFHLIIYLLMVVFIILPFIYTTLSPKITVWQ